MEKWEVLDQLGKEMDDLREMDDFNDRFEYKTLKDSMNLDLQTHQLKNNIDDSKAILEVSAHNMSILNEKIDKLSSILSLLCSDSLNIKINR